MSPSTPPTGSLRAEPEAPQNQTLYPNFTQASSCCLAPMIQTCSPRLYLCSARIFELFSDGRSPPTGYHLTSGVRYPGCCTSFRRSNLRYVLSLLRIESCFFFFFLNFKLNFFEIYLLLFF